MIFGRALSFLRHTRAAASAEFILAVPMMLPLIFGSMEAGNFFWSQQKLTQAVRDGARYAARLNYNDVCPSLDSSAETAIQNLTRTGGLAGTGPSKLPGMTNAQVIVTANCGAFTSTGIFAGYGGAGAIITVDAERVPYRSILGALGVIDDTYNLAATAHAPVIGI